MAEVTNVYKKRFSNIADIQIAEQLYYNLYETKCNKIATYGVELISKKCENSDKILIDGISNSKAKVLNIITYLYENSVKLESALAVIGDMINYEIDNDIQFFT